MLPLHLITIFIPFANIKMLTYLTPFFLLYALQSYNSMLYFQPKKSCSCRGVPFLWYRFKSCSSLLRIRATNKKWCWTFFFQPVRSSCFTNRLDKQQIQRSTSFVRLQSDRCGVTLRSALMSEPRGPSLWVERWTDGERHGIQ